MLRASVIRSGSHGPRGSADGSPAAISSGVADRVGRWIQYSTRSIRVSSPPRTAISSWLRTWFPSMYVVSRTVTAVGARIAAYGSTKGGASSRRSSTAVYFCASCRRASTFTSSSSRSDSRVTIQSMTLALFTTRSPGISPVGTSVVRSRSSRPTWARTTAASPFSPHTIRPPPISRGASSSSVIVSWPAVDVSTLFTRKAARTPKRCRSAIRMRSPGRRSIPSSAIPKRAVSDSFSCSFRISRPTRCA